MNSESEKNSGNSDSTKASQSPNVTGFTGGTGGPGSAAHPHTISHEAIPKESADEKQEPVGSLVATTNPQVTVITPDEKMSFAEYEKLYGPDAVSVMIGGTGGIGGFPKNPDEAKAKKIQASDILDEIHNGEFKDLSLEEKVTELVSTNRRVKPILANIQSQTASIGVMQGEMANIIKSEVCVTRGGPAAWPIFQRKYITPYISQSSLRKYMNAASIPNVAKYFALGIDRLGEFGAMIEASGLSKDSDPIKTILHMADITISGDMPIVEFKNVCDAAVLRHRLEKNKLPVPFETVRAVCGCGLNIDKDDIAEMQYRKKMEQDPVQYLVSLMENPEDREDLLTHIKKDSETGKRVRSSSKSRIKDINNSVQQWCETLVEINKLDKYETPIEVQRIEALIEQLETLKQKVRSTTDKSSESNS